MEIKKFTSEELLNDFFNYHLKEVVSSWINIKIFEGMSQTEIVGERTTPGMLGDKQMPVKIPIKVKEALERENQKFNNQIKTIKAIEQRRKEISSLEKLFN